MKSKDVEIELSTSDVTSVPAISALQGQHKKTQNNIWRKFSQEFSKTIE
jgi:hypothetical protein